MLALSLFLAVFRIRDILLVVTFCVDPWICKLDMDPGILHLSAVGHYKNEFFSNFFCLVLTVGTLTSVFKDNMSLRSHKTVEIMDYLIFLLVDGRIRMQIRMRTNNY